MTDAVYGVSCIAIWLGYWAELAEITDERRGEQPWFPSIELQGVAGAMQLKMVFNVTVKFI